MLILVLKPGEEIVIGDEEIIITALDQNARTLALGFDAPHHVAINRRTVFDKKKSSGEIPDTQTINRGII